MEGSREDNALTASRSGRDEEIATLPRGISHFHLRGPFMDFLTENLRFPESSYWIKHPYALYTGTHGDCLHPSDGLHYPLQGLPRAGIEHGLDGGLLGHPQHDSGGTLLDTLAEHGEARHYVCHLEWGRLWSFQIRHPYKIMGVMPSNQQFFRTEFMYVYRAKQWDFPVVPLLEGSNSGLNRSVPRMTEDKARDPSKRPKTRPRTESAIVTPRGTGERRDVAKEDALRSKGKSVELQEVGEISPYRGEDSPTPKKRKTSDPEPDNRVFIEKTTIEKAALSIRW
ncbi:hypothetical protein BVRB_5g111410 [Beta vulgaris subsp. vulgaris]|nr:hypothetical protein BVRB_5g111410 [Beta vulgaris subsp. vulgaris]